MTVRASSFLILLSVIVLAGCGGGERDVTSDDLKSMTGGDLKETVPVSGKVTVAGAPAGDVKIFAYAKDKGMEPVGECRTVADGTYCWTTYQSCDGLVPGSYKLGFVQVGEEGRGKKSENPEDLLKGKYKNPAENDFSLEVVSGMPQTEANYALE